MSFPITAFFLMAGYLTTILPLSKELTVTFPNSTSTVQRGKPITIMWCTNSTLGMVSILLMRKSKDHQSQKMICLGKHDVHLEELEWLVPFDIPPGVQYYIMLKNQDNIYCSEPFTIDSNESLILSQ
ncbi:hypothetical protein BD560DRAFT_395863 [Blakeslea trispora]|nr:hypothetical protein BD560DRAFT_395863 [Blakeslea trispora]